MKIFQGEELPQPKSMLLVSFLSVNSEVLASDTGTEKRHKFYLFFLIIIYFYFSFRPQLKQTTLQLWQSRKTLTQNRWNM